MAKRKNKTQWKQWILWMYAILLVTFSLAIYIWIRERRTHFVRYAAFGIEVPVNYLIHGIDVSKYQDYIDWNSVHQMNIEGVRIGFAFIKATEGLGNEDAMFARNWKKAREAGVVRGAYHFFIATKGGRAQAENFIQTVELHKGDLPPVLDIEQTYGVDPEKLQARAREWLQTVQAHYGVVPLVYTNVDFYNHNLDGAFDGYPLWVAHYLQPDQPRIGRPWNFWQHAVNGRVNGIDTRVDFNVFNGDSLSFQNILIH